ncbi:MAG: heme-binding domain-containing protein [Ginsengibacter sp.]
MAKNTLNILKKILFLLLFVFIAIQFIQPARNTNGQVLSTDISKVVSVPENVQSVLKVACYDCHSNNTRYTWYVNIQPIGWMMAKHVKNGKHELNFSDFGSYSTRKQQSKLKAIASQIKDDEMPLTEYKIMHGDARLSKEEKDLIINWASVTKNSIQNK